MQEILRQAVGRNGVHHAVMAVRRRDASFHWMEAAGSSGSDGAPMRPDAPFFVASVTKLYTAAVILRLHERRFVDVEEPMAAYLPPELIAGLHRMGSVDYTGSITVRNLLSHTSGLAELRRPPKRRPQHWRSSRRRGRFRVRHLRCRRHLSRPAPASLSPTGAAGEATEGPILRHTNYQLLGAIIETVTNQPLHQTFDELLFRPLRLRHTYLYGRSEPLDPLPEPAIFWVGKKPLDAPLLMRSLGPDGGIVSTAEDTIEFMSALVGGRVFDHPETGALMQERWNSLAFTPANPRVPGWPIEYGLGMMRFRMPRILTPLRPMPAVIGHTDAIGSWLFYCPQLDLLLSGTVNQAAAAAAPYRLVPRLLRAYSGLQEP